MRYDTLIRGAWIVDVHTHDDTHVIRPPGCCPSSRRG